MSLLSCALNHWVLLAGALQAGRRPGDGPTVRAWHRGLHIPLHEVKQRVPPGVGEVVVRRAFQSLSRKYKLSFSISNYNISLCSYIHFHTRDAASCCCWTDQMLFVVMWLCLYDIKVTFGAIACETCLHMPYCKNEACGSFLLLYLS